MDDHEEEAVRRLIEGAGPRPPIPQEDLDAISAAARSAWREQVRGRTESRAESRTRPPFRAWAAALAAAVVIALGLAGWLARRDVGVLPAVARLEAARSPVLLATPGAAPRRLTPGEEVPRGGVLRTDDAGGASLRLTGGATLRLAAGTRLRLATAAALDLERGAVYLDTGSAAGGETVEVRTSVGTAKDVGTRFAVALVGSPGEAMRVQVREGAVAVERGGRSVLAPAGQELLLRRDGTLERRRLAGHGRAWEWVAQAAPPFEIEGRTLRQFLDWVARENGWQVRFADPDLASAADGIVLHGSLGELRPDQAPFAVLPGAGLAGELRDGALIVRRGR